MFLAMSPNNQTCVVLFNYYDYDSGYFYFYFIFGDKYDSGYCNCEYSAY